MTTRLHVLPCYSERELRGKGLPGEFTTIWLLLGSSFRKLWLGSSLPKFCFPVIGWYSLKTPCSGIASASCTRASFPQSMPSQFRYLFSLILQQYSRMSHTPCHSQEHPWRPTKQQGDAWGPFKRYSHRSSFSRPWSLDQDHVPAVRPGRRKRL